MEKKPDYFLNGNVIVNQTEISDVKCKIYLPERVLGKPYMQFQLTSDQYDILSKAFKGEFKASRKNFEGKVDAQIIAPTVFFKKVYRRNWGDDLVEYSFEGEPQDLKIIHNYDLSMSDPNTTIIFSLSPNDSLGPVIIEQLSMDGSIKVEKSHHLETQFYKDEILILDKDYKSRETEGKERLQWSYLVAKIHISDPTFLIEQVNELLLSKIDDFLLIASLATSIRTACLGWEAIQGKTTISYYRGNLTFSTGKKEEILDQGLVPKRYLQEFLTRSYDVFLHYENKAVLRGAIYSLVPGNDKTLETSFLSLFAGLEMLLLDYRRQKN